MGNKNYSQFSNKKFQKANQDVTEILNSVDDEQELEPINEPEPTKGVVAGCAKLRVRAESNTDADVLSEVDSGTELSVDLENSTEDFYKVVTADGINGYCMKKFINIL